MRIGYVANEYPEVRNIIGKVDEFEYVNCKYRNILLYKRYILSMGNRIRNTYSMIDDKCYNDIFSYRGSNFNIDIFHFFNHINLGKGNWISTFETFLPRYKEFILINEKRDDEFIMNDYIKRAFEAISKDGCKKIISLSENGKLVENLGLEYYKQYKDDILKKIEVIKPPQELILGSIEEKQYISNNIITFTFIGNELYRKGGYEVLLAFDSILDKDPNLNIQLNLIGDIEKYHSKYNSMKNSTLKEYETAKKIIRRHSSKIKYYDSLPYKNIREIVKRTDVGILPTWMDTYGYSVLEFQSAGCPVISSDIRALPEINNDDIGWMIKLPKDKFGALKIDKESDKNLIRELIVKALEKSIIDIYNNSNRIIEKGKLAYNRIIDEHNVLEYSKKLKNIYVNSINN